MEPAVAIQARRDLAPDLVIRGLRALGAMGFASEMLIGSVFLLGVALVRGEAFTAPFAAPIDGRALLAWGYLVTAGSRTNRSGSAKRWRWC
jgi:hypothetical protein